MAAILNYLGHLVLLSIVLYMSLYIYNQASFLFKKVQVLHFLLKCKGGILYSNGHVTYDLPMTPRIMSSSKLHYGISKPKFRANKHISRISRTVLLADYFFGGHFENM